MKKLIIQFTFIFLIISATQAQNKNGNLSFSIGSSFPIGNFASKDMNNDKAGWAKTGASLSLKFNYQLEKSKFGLCASLYSQFNKFDADQLVKSSENLYPDVTWTIESTSWKTNCILFGGFASLPISKIVNFEPHGMIGLMNSNCPELTTFAKFGGNTNWVKQNSTSAMSLAYLIGAGFNFKITNKLNVLGNIDYIGSKPEFLNVEMFQSNGYRNSLTFSQNISILNLSLGLGISL